MSNSCLVAHTLRDSESLLHYRVEIPASAVRLLGLRPGGFDLRDDLRFAQNQRVQTRCNAENMQEGCFIQQAVEMLPLAQFQAELGRQISQYGICREAGITRPKHKLRTVAGAQHDYFFDALGSLQGHEGLEALAFADPESLAHRYRCRPVIQADDH